MPLFAVTLTRTVYVNARSAEDATMLAGFSGEHGTEYLYNSNCPNDAQAFGLSHNDDYESPVVRSLTDAELHDLKKTYEPSDLDDSQWEELDD